MKQVGPKTIEEIGRQNDFSRNDLLIILETLSLKLDPSGFSRTLDMKESLGFRRNDEPE